MNREMDFHQSITDGVILNDIDYGKRAMRED